MSKCRSVAVRLLGGVTGATLLAYLIYRIGPGALWKETLAVGWGMCLILFLGGISHCLKSIAWRFTFPTKIRSSISAQRALGLRLISEAIGQFGLAGQVAGEGIRVSLLGSSAPLATRIASATIDRGLYTVSAAIVGVTGLIGAMVLFPLPHIWKAYSFVFAGAMFAFLVVAVVAVQRQWSLVSLVVRGLRRMPRLSTWLNAKEHTLYSAEQELFNFHREAPTAFWTSFALNLASQVLAILEVYLLLWFMHARIAFLGAFVFEAFTKLVNAVGGIIPGNVGTYEGGSMLIARLFGVTGAIGLAVGVCRRIRALFWAAIGGVCLIVMSRSLKADNSADTVSTGMSETNKGQTTGEYQMKSEPSDSTTVIILTGASSDYQGFIPALAHIGTLPAMLRTVLLAKSAGSNRIISCSDSTVAPAVEKEVRRTGRVPDSLEWYEAADKIDFGALARHLSAGVKTVFVSGGRSYQPALLRKAIAWNEPQGALAFCSGAELIGIYVLSEPAARLLAEHSNHAMATLEDMHEWLQSRAPVEVEQVEDQAWQKISCPADRLRAETKLNSWLVKPTDGLFARMNRKVSIPISRWLLQWPITPNMVTFFTLWVSFGAGLFFAYGGYWATLVGAVLSVWASILDGCDGEVARLKLQVTDFGCWLETICDYLYYVFVFGGMIIGFTRTMGPKFTLTWGPMLLLGAVASFFAVGFARHHFSANRPEAFLSIWQGKAEQRKSNPLLYVGRHCEFIIRRCFLPYAFLVFALLNVLPYAFVVTAIGANIVWCIALYSCFTLSRSRKLTSSSTSVITPGSSPATI